nr:GyrI-like domain-containing protein [Renibacterium salmoninarum]
MQPLYPQLYNRISALGITPIWPGIAYYENTDDGGVLVHASAPASADVVSDGSFTIVELPAVEQAATIVHQGLMDNVMSTIQTMARWIETNGYVSTGLNRELYLDYGCNDQPETWVTEMQEPVRKA